MTAKQRGFTLIEILIVLIIISIVTGVATLAVRDRGGQTSLDKFVRNLQRTLQLAEDETLFRRRTLGLYVDRLGLSYFSYADEKWHPVDDRIYRPITFLSDMEVLLYVDGNPVTLETDLVHEPIPQVLFVPDAEPITFQLLFSLPNALQRRLERTPSGAIRTDLIAIEQDGEENTQ